MAKFFKIPFAATGDVLPVPDAAQPDGSVSYAQGFGPDYQRKTDGTDPLAKTVPRDSTNALFNDLTGAVGEIQLNGVPAWQSVGAPYPINAIVRHNNKNWVSQITNNNDTPVEGASWSEQPANSYTKAQIDTKLSLKANSATTLSGYGITDAYTKTEGDARYLRTANNLSDLSNKASARTSLELGTAAQATLTTSQNDITAGRVLKVSDFGLGGFPSADSADPDALQYCGFFKAFNSAKMPTLATFSGLHIQRDTGNARASQIVWSDSTNRTYTRTRADTGTWSAWYELYTTANVSAFMQTLMPSSDAAAARATLGASALGVGQTLQSVTRTAGTVYTNSTGKPIFVIANIISGTSVGGYLSCSIDGGSDYVFASCGGSAVNSSTGCGSTIIPNGSTYKFTTSGLVLASFAEMR